MKRQNELAQIKSALGNFRRLSDRVLSDEDDKDVIDPALFEQLSLVAAEIAELERTRRRRRRDRALAIAQQVSELFPDMAGRGGAFVRLGDENLDRSAIAIQLAVEANEQLAESDAELRAAVENRDYGSVRDFAGRAREHQAAIAAQKDILASLLALVADDDGDSDGDGDGDGDNMDSPPPGSRQEFADNGASDMAAHRDAEPSLADARRTAMAAEASSEVTRAEPEFAPAPKVAEKPVVDTIVAAHVSDNVHAAAMLADAEAASIAVDIRQEQVGAEAGGAARNVGGASAAREEDRASFVIRNGMMIPEPLARKSKDPKFTEELTKRFESARENVRSRLEGDNQPGSGGLLTKFRRGRMPGAGMAEAD